MPDAAGTAVSGTSPGTTWPSLTIRLSEGVVEAMVCVSSHILSFAASLAEIGLGVITRVAGAGAGRAGFAAGCADAAVPITLTAAKTINPARTMALSLAQELEPGNGRQTLAAIKTPN